ncbi:squamosa promoter-binding-like protein 16 [Solanum dulcamara]|uniref:squamosa promoter-binding-like protein 16 n=1 Tax=Solanum dulcamara TaxID=45834 RepID=UPI0024851B12|nr:squamosa promoter-binding-like protein 16 [Solanum dulcamara]XP_055810619.1 squamosa promoter-binding-like protein 16 [Solanum dulcamara]XP_055810620.1 squamosa promoter-binding-like protein 16 [Solanum dulcamara]XP_055810621.1 squamosa promoter-binding-like protein 16 [Solanum dulcamara]XP_055810623.1 squamosa promoter-binding-like protein 16 [Solanum dulcamara]
MESSSSKRAKAPGSIAHCLVDGCSSDLSECREYHRRHKVCEVHSKTAKVTIAGRDQRFCQQCSRFHSLVEFDDGKRSCRKRLDGHNRRRRKPQPDSMAKNSGLLFGQQGTKLLSFSSQQIFPSAVVSSAWADVEKRDSDMVLYNNQSHINYMDSQNSFPDSSAHSYKGGSQFQFMQGSDRSLTEASSICQPLLEHPTSAAGISSSGQKIFSSGLNEIVDSDRALSLLSSAPAVTREIGLSHMVQQPASIPRSQSHGLQYGGLSHFPFAQDFNSRPQDSHVSDSSSPLHFHDMLQNAQDGSSTSGGSQQTLAFMWD